MMKISTGASRLLASASVGAVALGLATGCGSSSSGSKTTAASGQLTVLAAASLSKTFPKIDSAPRYTFGGSGMLATQIQQGAPADVFAAASPKQTTALYKAGLVDQPVEFATNTLVMVVPNDNPAHIKSVADITKPGVKIVVCNATVPCGTYASTAFTNLGITAAATKNIKSQATDVTQVVADVAAGQGDVGFVYITDAKAANGKVRAIRLPAKAKPLTMDYIAVVKSTKKAAAAQAFLAQVVSSQGQATLRAAGFGAP